LLPVTPEIALVDEHCSYFGAFCHGSADHGYGASASSTKHQNGNYTQLDDIQTPSGHYSTSNVLFTTGDYIKVTLMWFLINSFYFLVTACVTFVDRKWNNSGLHGVKSKLF
jgi:mannosidase alpha-like ER degradation enhancer 2